MKRLKRFIRRKFGFTQRQTNGFLVLLTLMVLSVTAPFFYRPASIPYNPTADKHTLDSLMVLLEDRNALVYASRSKKPVKLFRFDPNKITAEQWQQLGINRYVAQRIINYRTKAGNFKYREDLQRIYGLPDSVYQRLYAYIELPVKPEKAGFAANRPGYTTTYPNAANRSASTQKAFRLQPIDINTADTTELKKIRGIGSKLSQRILKYRNRLGGFHSPEQMQEVFGLPPNILDSLNKYTYIENDYITNKINLNSATYEQLKEHPYMTFSVAKAIIAYRQQHGPYKQTTDIKRIKIMTEPLFTKLQPYLSVE